MGEIVTFSKRVGLHVSPRATSVCLQNTRMYTTLVGRTQHDQFGVVTVLLVDGQCRI